MELRDSLCEILLGKHYKDLKQLEEDAITTFRAIDFLPDNIHYNNIVAESKAAIYDNLMDGPEEKYIDSILDDLETFIIELRQETEM